MDRRKKIYEIVLFSILSTIIIVMSFTPIGYIKTLGIEITLLMIPVAIGAILLGPGYGACLGLIFGLTSFLQCVFGFSAGGAMLLAINGFYTFIVCVIPRTLMGFLTGIIYKLLSKVTKEDMTPSIVACISSSALNTIFYMVFLCLFFYNTELIQQAVTSTGATNPFMFIILYVGINAVVEMIVACIVGVAITKVIKKVIIKR